MLWLFLNLNRISALVIKAPFFGIAFQSRQVNEPRRIVASESRDAIADEDDSISVLQALISR